MPTTLNDRIKGWFTVALTLAFAAALELEYAVTSAAQPAARLDERQAAQPAR